MVDIPVRWREFCTQIGAETGVEAVFVELDRAYTAKDRHYHNWKHIGECLLLLDIHADSDTSLLRESKNLIEFALWFHDSIYNSRSSMNEAKSADLACSSAEKMAVFQNKLEAIRQLIMATKDHHAEDEAARLIVDIDLAILGADTARYDEYEADIRREYAWVPQAIFMKKRRQMLQAFLVRPQIYQTESIRAAREIRARNNLQRAIEKLR